jgi:hypothetical protein
LSLDSVVVIAVAATADCDSKFEGACVTSHSHSCYYSSTYPSYHFNSSSYTHTNTCTHTRICACSSSSSALSQYSGHFIVIIVSEVNAEVITVTTAHQPTVVCIHTLADDARKADSHVNHVVIIAIIVIAARLAAHDANVCQSAVVDGALGACPLFRLEIVIVIRSSTATTTATATATTTATTATTSAITTVAGEAQQRVSPVYGETVQVVQYL